MSMTLSGNGTITGLVSGGLPDGTVLPADLSTGGPYWDTSGNLTLNTGNLVIGTSGKVIQDSAGVTILSTRSSERVSTFFGDYGASGSAIATTILTAAASGLWAVSGRIFFKRNSDSVGVVLPFATSYDGNVGRNVVLGSGIVGSSTQTPTLAYSSDNLQLTTPAYCYAYVMIDGIIVRSGAITLNATIFA